MGFIRGGLLTIAVVFLFFSLLIGNMFIALNLSISNEALKESISENFDEIIEPLGGDAIGSSITDKIGEMEVYCDGGNDTDFVFSQGRYTITIPCEVVSQGEDAIIKEGVSDFVDGVYYDKYTCKSALKCISGKQPLFFFSEQAKDYFGSKMYYFIALSLLLIAAIFFLVESKINLPIITGILIVLSALPFMKIERLFSLFEYSYLKVIPIILSKSFTVFVIMFSIGIVLFAFGVAFKFFNFGSSILQKLDKKIEKKKGVKN